MKKLFQGQLKNKAFVALIWVMISLIILGGATFAWFTFASYTNVKPMTGSVGNGGADLKISNSESGPFSNETELIVNGTTENLQPISTGDQRDWFSAVTHNYQGISTRFQNVTSEVDSLTMYGTVYLQSEGGACDVYFDREKLSFGGDPQLLSSCRLGITITTKEETKEMILNLDSYAVGAVEVRKTTDSDNVVIEAIDSAGNPHYVTDPAVHPDEYSTTVDIGAANGAEVLTHITEDEVIRFDWRLYMEGCDENCINTAQDNTITMNLAFIGIGTH